MTDAIHAARWIAQLAGQPWRVIVVASSAAERIRPELAGVVVIRSPAARFRDLLLRLGLRTLAQAFERLKHLVELAFPGYRVGLLRRAIRKYRPNLIHAIEMQSAGYMTLEAIKACDPAPPWLMTTWGHDIYLYSRLKDHRQRVLEVLARCDYLSGDCARDVKLAGDLGFKGKALPAGPVSGGFDLARLAPLRSTRTALRRRIVLKGYQGITGRALCALRALERCAELLAGYTVAIFSAAPEVEVAAELFTGKTGVATRILAPDTPHQQMLEQHAAARISLGLSISDGASVSMTEAMVMGSFPIQSDTACAAEWIDHGVNGLIVPPEDPQMVESALRVALTDDALVDRAAEFNWQLSLARLDQELLKEQAVRTYRALLAIHAPRPVSSDA